MKNSLPDSLLNQLPVHESIEEIPQAFSDSTHRLWRLLNPNSDNKNYFLKVCSNTQSPFWQIMNDLFDFNLVKEIDNFSNTYRFIDQVCSLEIPSLIQAEVSTEYSYILTNELSGKACTSDANDLKTIQLANHLAELHEKKIQHWGSLNKPQLKPNDWPLRLKSVLLESTKKWGGVFLQSDLYLKQAIQACDLRDQFLEKDNNLSALVDLDSFVYAPRELDFVILEYILSPNQLSTFKQTYSKSHMIPNIKLVRPAYRLLLFYMEILGENDLEEWMKKPHFFQ